MIRKCNGANSLATYIKYINENFNQTSKNDLPSYINYNKMEWTMNAKIMRCNDLISYMNVLYHTCYYNKYQIYFRYRGYSLYMKDKKRYKYTKGICLRLLKDELG